MNNKASSPENSKKSSRIIGIDMARALALLTMAIYHFAWDLEFFGYASPGLTQRPEWIYFARSIASSFMILVGISLILGHRQQMNYRSYAIRLAKVALAAALISLVTWFFMPGGFIFFGILHSIALSSIFALAFLRLPWAVNLAAATFFITGPLYLKSEILASPALYWLGLSPSPPASNDYVPIFPWFGLVLLGMAMAQIAVNTGFDTYLARWRPNNKFTRSFSFFSRHSLLTYLIHQPLLLGLIYVFAAITGGPDRTPAFVSVCEQNCSLTRDGVFCTKFCSCIVNDLKQQSLWAGIHDRQININTDPRVKSVTKACTINSE